MKNASFFPNYDTLIRIMDICLQGGWLFLQVRVYFQIKFTTNNYK